MDKFTIQALKFGGYAAAGIIPNFLNPGDSRTAREQFDLHYVAGWSPMKGFTLDRTTMALSYPGDPPLEPLFKIEFRDELIYIYEFAWVMVLQTDGSFEVCRMD